MIALLVCVLVAKIGTFPVSMGTRAPVLSTLDSHRAGQPSAEREAFLSGGSWLIAPSVTLVLTTILPTSALLSGCFGCQ